ncbi:hypothetical protein WMQ53_23570 [Vibrio diabolicus]|uniref:hypothetical protein n=1 Tax=Vibrio diabolicus TaxID=50719 RepID=UPI00375229FC
MAKPDTPNLVVIESTGISTINDINMPNKDVDTPNNLPLKENITGSQEQIRKNLGWLNGLHIVTNNTMSRTSEDFLKQSQLSDILME